MRMSSLKIALVGVGNIGSTFAYYLAKAGHEVTVVARPNSTRHAQLKRDGGIITKAGERASAQVADQLDEEAFYDLVIVTVLAHQADALLPSLQRSKARRIHFMFNTFQPERLRDAMGGDRSSFGMPFVMARLDADGRLDATVSASRKTLHSDQRWADLFSNAGIASAFEPDMLLWLRCHVPLCIAMESISVTAQARGGGASWSDAMAVARGLHGGFAIIRGLGYRLHPRAKAVLDASPNVVLAGMLWSISRVGSFRDLLATGAIECGTLIDRITASAQTISPVPAASVQALTKIRPAAKQ